MTKALDDITLSQVRYTGNLTDSLFVTAYRKLVTNGDLTLKEKLHLLRLGVIFLNSSDKNVEKLGYNIILAYSNKFNDYDPLYDIALSRDYMPIVGFIESQNNSNIFQDSNFSEEYLSAYKESFKIGLDNHTTYRSKGQIMLSSFSKSNSNIAIVAPTSYGKSEMLIDKVRTHLSEKICIIVPTKALLSQTKRLILGDLIIKQHKPHIITHPDMYRDTSSYIAILTQERLLRLFKKNQEATLDRILVDEAHNILDKEDRAQLLAQVLLIAQKRNQYIDISFFTPFLTDTRSLDVVNRDIETKGKIIEEFMKIEKLHYTRLGEKKLFLYDQFLNISFEAGTLDSRDELDFVVNNRSLKNIIYLNRPQQVERTSLKLAYQNPLLNSDRINAAAEAIGKLIHPEYNIIECMRHGVLFHHGGLPEVIRLYVEELFSKYEEFNYLVTTSTLLEGVNTPAEKIFILNPCKGRKHLTASQFKNLIGRICRFREVFDPETGNLSMLEPRVYVLDGASSAVDFSPLNFFHKVANSSLIISDKVENPLLLHSSNTVATDKALQYLENIELGTSGLISFSSAKTEIGKLCFANNIHDFDILASENVLEINLNKYTNSGNLEIRDANSLIDALWKIFLVDVDISRDEDLVRIHNYEPARNFYSMFIQWRSEGMSYGEMIARFLRYWAGLRNKNIYIGSKWGEGGFRNQWIDMNQKSHEQRVNLAVAKIKEDQDFVDYKIMAYVEILNDLSLIEEEFYNRVKFGTADRNIICLLKNGLSYELSKLLVEKYLEYISLDLENDLIEYKVGLIAKMEENEENEVLVFEVSSYL